MRADLFRALQARRRAGEAVALVTRLADGEQALIGDDWFEGPLALDEASTAAARRRLREDRSGRLADLDPELFVHVYNRPLRLVLVGAVHVSQALVPIARVAGYQVTVIDPRTAFASDARFPGVELSTEWPDDALQRLAPDRRTALVTLTHDPKLDDPALTVALGSEAFFIGALGSRKTHALRVQRLREAGLDAAAIERIHAPVGLPLGGRLPPEIAIAIMAQITAVLRGGGESGTGQAGRTRALPAD